MSRNLNINLYLRPFNIAIYGKLSKLFFSVLFQGYKPQKKNVQNLLIFVYLFFPKNSTIDSRKPSGMIGGGKLLDPSLNYIFNALSIDV